MPICGRQLGTIAFGSLQPLGKMPALRPYQESMNPLHPNLMEPAERLHEIAKILALGHMRLKLRKSSNLSAASGESSLDCTAHRSSHVDGLKSDEGSSR